MCLLLSKFLIVNLSQMLFFSWRVCICSMTHISPAKWLALFQLTGKEFAPFIILEIFVRSYQNACVSIAARMTLGKQTKRLLFPFYFIYCIKVSIASIWHIMMSVLRKGRLISSSILIWYSLNNFKKSHARITFQICGWWE